MELCITVAFPFFLAIKQIWKEGENSQETDWLNAGHSGYAFLADTGLTKKFILISEKTFWPTQH